MIQLCMQNRWPVQIPQQIQRNRSPSLPAMKRASSTDTKPLFRPPSTPLKNQRNSNMETSFTHLLVTQGPGPLLSAVVDVGEHTLRCTRNQNLFSARYIQNYNHSHYLEFVTARRLGSVRLAGLHEAKSGILDFLLCILLDFHQVLVGLLKSIDTGLKVGFGLFHLFVAVGDHLVEFVSGHSKEFFDFCLFLGITEIDVGRGAHRLEAFCGKFFEGIIVASAFVVLESSRISPLDGGVSLDTLFGTKGFARGSAIDIGDECGIGISKCVH